MVESRSNSSDWIEWILFWNNLLKLSFLRGFFLSGKHLFQTEQKVYGAEGYINFDERANKLSTAPKISVYNIKIVLAVFSGVPYCQDEKWRRGK